MPTEYAVAATDAVTVAADTPDSRIESPTPTTSAIQTRVVWIHSNRISHESRTLQEYSLVMRASKHSGEPVRVLLGGGIGSGKTLAGRRFRELGAVVVDADKLGHAVIGKGGEAHEQVRRRWPSVVTDSATDRAALGRIVFQSTEQLRELEAMTHPAIIRTIVAIATIPADLVVEIPLILEIPGSWTAVYVDASPDRCIRRAVDRGLDEEGVRKRAGNQPPRSEWLAWADEVLDNNGSTEQLCAGVDELWKELRV